MDKKTMNMREAAEALGVSTDTIRRRIKDGKIIARKIQGAYGPEWEIDPDTLAEAQQIYETVPVKHNVSIERLETIIQDATREGAARAMESVLKEIQELRKEIELLHKQLEEKDHNKKGLISRLFNK